MSTPFSAETPVPELVPARYQTANATFSRGLASRAPYFHNGIAATIPAIIDHYEAALGFDFTDQEEEDLAAFLAAL